MRLPTASSLELAAACPASHVLPEGRTWTREQSAARAAGTTLHGYVLDLVTVGRDAALAKVPEELRPLVAAIPDHALPRDTSCYEIPLAWDYEDGTSRVLASGGHRDYSAACKTEVCGTADFIRPDRSGTWDVLDWKFSPRPVTPARENLQLAFFALCCLSVVDGPRAERVRVTIARIDTDGLHVDTHEYVAWDRDALAARVRDTVARVQRAAGLLLTMPEGRALATYPGEACRWCPALRSCPSHRDTVSALARDGDAGELPEIATATPEFVGAAWSRLQQARRYLEQIEHSIREYVSAFGDVVPLPDGRELRIQNVETRSVDAALAFPVLVDLVGVERASDAIDHSTTLAAVERAVCADALDRREARDRMAATVAMLESAGAIKRSGYMKLVPAKRREGR